MVGFLVAGAIAVVALICVVAYAVNARLSSTSRTSKETNQFGEQKINASQSRFAEEGYDDGAESSNLYVENDRPPTPVSPPQSLMLDDVNHEVPQVSEV